MLARCIECGHSNNGKALTMTNIDHAAYQAKTRTMCEAELRYTINDCKAAMSANPEGHKAGYYADEVHYCAMELKRRSK